jgi:hypothetical protein
MRKRKLTKSDSFPRKGGKGKPKTNVSCLPVLPTANIGKNGSLQDAKVRFDFMGCEIGRLVFFD